MKTFAGPLRPQPRLYNFCKKTAQEIKQRTICIRTQFRQRPACVSATVAPDNSQPGERCMSKIVGLLLLFTTSLAVAQDTPKFEVFGGYSFASASRTLTLDRSRPNLNGWNASVAGNFNRWIGIVGDF